MTKFYYCLCFVLLCMSNNVEAQTANSKYSVPDEYSFDSKEDYTKYEPQILTTIDWYLATSMAFETDKRVKAKQFFMKWVIGDSNVNIIVDGDIIPFINVSPELLIPYMMGWTKYSLENNYSRDNNKCCIAAIRATTEFYDKNKFFFKDDECIDKYKKMNDNKLSKYLSKFPSFSDKKDNN